MGERKIKCVVWDIDNTLWDGILLEGDNVAVRDGIVDIIKTLDNRGILQSIASKNDFDLAMAKLSELGVDEYFIYPQINWNPKSFSVKTIAKLINISIDTIMFIDDQEFEREEVAFSLPEVICTDSKDLSGLLEMAELKPRFITEDSKRRRGMYRSSIKRNQDEEAFNGTQEEFMASLNMIFTISEAEEGDLQRVEELTVRTHQLNSTGYTYSYEELDSFRRSKRHRLFIASLDDKYGTYGKIGLALIECEEMVWTVKLLLMSCRVMSRGSGTILMNHIMRLAKEAGVCLRAEFVPNDRNRMMYVTYKFAGFKEILIEDNIIVFENDLRQIQPLPKHVKLCI